MPSLFWIRLISYLPFKTTAKTSAGSRTGCSNCLCSQKLHSPRYFSEPIVAAISAGIDTVLTLYQNQIKRGIEGDKTYEAVHLFSVTQKNWFKFGQI